MNQLISHSHIVLLLFAVPYFFVCSGYFLGRKIYGKDLQKSDYRLIIKNYAQRLLKPYLIWGCWYFLIVLVNEIVRNHKNVIEALKSGIHNWIVSSPGGGDYGMFKLS